MHLIFEKEQLEVLELEKGLQELSAEYGFSFGLEGQGCAVHCENVPGDDLTIALEGGRALFRFDFSRRNHFYRSLGLLLENLQDGKTSFTHRETAYFRHNGPMLDMSQSYAVMKPHMVKQFLRQISIMGMSQCLLYMEDSFDVPEEPYFGYMRSRYSYEELKELDDYGYALGIEVIPSIQGLAHYEEVLKWDVYTELREAPDCLVPEQEATYTFLRHVFTAASKPFRTKRIGVCMDEAKLLGRGIYLKRHGYVPQAEIFRRHLAIILEMTREMGLRPMVMDDMFFEPYGVKKNPKTIIPQSDLDSIPKGFDLLCWDYYLDDPDKIRTWLKKDQQISDHLIFEGGIWNWVSYAPRWDHTLATTNAALGVCKELGIDDIQATTWGDTGTECDIRMIGPGLQLFAEHGFMKEAPSREYLAKRFRFCGGGDFDLFYRTQDIDLIPRKGAQSGEEPVYVPTKYILWQDILSGMFDPHIRDLALKDHYAALNRDFDREYTGPYATVFEMYRCLVRVLELKGPAGLELHDAYAAGDRQTLARYAGEVLPELLRRVCALEQVHIRCWQEVNKPLGWEVIGLRYGGLRTRIEYAILALEDYLAGRRERLEELEEKQLPFNGDDMPKYYHGYARIYSAGRIANTAFVKYPKK